MSGSPQRNYWIFVCSIIRCVTSVCVCLCVAVGLPVGECVCSADRRNYVAVISSIAHSNKMCEKWRRRRRNTIKAIRTTHTHTHTLITHTPGPVNVCALCLSFRLCRRLCLREPLTRVLSFISFHFVSFRSQPDVLRLVNTDLFLSVRWILEIVKSYRNKHAFDDPN